jgi:hypothetical protein
MPHRVAALSLIAAAAVPLGAQQLGELGDGLNGHVDLEAQLFGNFGGRTLDPERSQPG